MTLDEQLEILNAAKRGEAEYKPRGASGWRWKRCTPDHQFSFEKNVYRIADPYAKLKAAAKDPTKQIRCIAKSYQGTNEWFDSPRDWIWFYEPKFYEIRDKPKAKKVVKYLCWESEFGTLSWIREDKTIHSAFLTRRPAFDMQTEVDDE